MADAGAGEQRGGGGPGGADPDDGDAGGTEQSLTGFSDAGEEDLAGVAGAEGIRGSELRGEEGRHTRRRLL